MTRKADFGSVVSCQVTRMDGVEPVAPLQTVPHQIESFFTSNKESENHGFIQFVSCSKGRVIAPFGDNKNP